MIETPRITLTTPRQMAYIHVTVPRAEIRNVMGPGIREVYDTLAAQGIAPAGPWFTHHLRMDPEVFDFEICVPVATPVAAAGRVRAGEVPAVKVASTVYRGPYEGLPDAWGAFDAWIASERLPTRGDLFEHYTAGPESGSDATGWRTALERPLAE